MMSIDSKGLLGEEQELSESSPLKINLSKSPDGLHGLETETVRTSKGNIFVAIQGDRARKQVLVTLHDVGLDYSSCFGSFFSFHQMQPLLSQFCVYHLNFPGQEEESDSLPENFVYPTMDDIAEAVKDVLDYFDVKFHVCFGVGAGANVFIRLAHKYPKYTEGLILINGVCTTSSWTEWGYQKMSSHYLKSKGMTQFTEDYLLWHYFGKVDELVSQDLVVTVRDHLHRIKHPRNLAFFIDSYIKRTNIKLVRPTNPKAPDSADTLRPSVLLICGQRSPHEDATVTLNSRLDPANSTWMKISDASGMVLEEQPTVVTNAFILFMQGLGYALKLRPPALSVGSPPEIDVSTAVC